MMIRYMRMWCGVFCLLPFLTMKAQTHIVMGEKVTFFSHRLNEHREIQVYVPQSYNDQGLTPQKYPVIYLLDGESNFKLLSAYVEKLSVFPYPSIPEMIVVGIVNTNRTRDFTPSKRNEETMTNEERLRMGKESGGNAVFFDFVENELVPFINKNYRTSGYQILIGHSFGGLAALNALLHHTHLFQAYIIHDPSIWWDEEYILKEYLNNKTHDFSNRTLFFTQALADKEEQRLFDHFHAIRKFVDFLDSNSINGLDYRYVGYADENHGTVPFRGNLDGLRYIFEGYTVDFRRISGSDSIKKSYQDLSRKLHHTFLPSEGYLKSIIKFFAGTHQMDKAKKMAEYCLELYPQSKIWSEIQDETF